jgi:ParB family chromosome partitioning protein
MPQQKRGLHNGLNELLNEYNFSDKQKSIDKNYFELSIDQLEPGGYQPRRTFNEKALRELADSIRAQGIIQPLIVRKTNAERYEIIAGERRWRAAQLAKLSTVPVIIKNVSNESALAISLIENIQRADLNVIEEAIALQRLIEEFDLTHEQAASAVGKSRTTVSNLLRLLNLVPAVRSLVEQNILEMGHARALLALDGTQQLQTANRVIKKNLTTRQTEKLVQKYLQQQSSTAQHTKPSEGSSLSDPDIQLLEQQLSDSLGLSTQLYHSKKGKGKLVIHYNSLDELDGVLKRWLNHT